MTVQKPRKQLPPDTPEWLTAAYVHRILHAITFPGDSPAQAASPSGTTQKEATS
ncbi:hypothetical protein [Acetobacter peroxydans]|uniref:Uncharacterized protein n=1 Tax=Acetobacter peroxydans TaxID=104098 RepID=A0A4Y3TXR6_9PROT|nr:hypothetical protein [Acetobacter peroxydans]NHO17081.1 hypothetical protein [Acetobacter peroxydans]GEB86593.1 hypothetical protein APE01nite_23900 [Acetobacter peroxydans]